MTFTKPMLAASLLPSDVEHTDDNILAAMQKLRYPVLATLKKDGVRCIKLGELASRTLKRIPNLSIQKRGEKIPAYFDMELWNPELSYDEIESIVMSREHPDSDKIQFHLLDRVNSDGYRLRYFHSKKLCEYSGWTDVVCEQPSLCNNAQELFEHFLRFETQDGEGLCFRTPDSPYKQGRSTLKEQYLVKLSRYIRTEVKIVGFKEQLMNTNNEKRNPVGMMARRKTVGGFGKNTLGAFQCEYKCTCNCRATMFAIVCPHCDGTGTVKIDVGTGVGLTDAKRKEIWDNRDAYFGKTIVVKHKPHGMKNTLRSPIFVGFREEGF